MDLIRTDVREKTHLVERLILTCRVWWTCFCPLFQRGNDYALILRCMIMLHVLNNLDGYDNVYHRRGW